MVKIIETKSLFKIGISKLIFEKSDAKGILTKKSLVYFSPPILVKSIGVFPTKLNRWKYKLIGNS